MTGLGKGKLVKISIRDANWLDDLLTQPANKDLREHFLYGSDIDYLHARAEAFKNNPVIRDADDLASRVHALREDADIVDPNWRLEFALVGGEVVRTLVPKDPGAPERAPVTINWTSVVPADSPERRALEDAGAYGYTGEIRLVGDMIRDYHVHGTRLLQGNDNPDEIVLGPIQGLTHWQPGELILIGPAGERLGVFLVNVGPRSLGRKGGVLEVTIGEVLTFTFRLPFDLNDQDGDNIKYTVHGVAGRPVTEVFEAADFVVKLGESATCELRINGGHILTIDSLNRSPLTSSRIFDGCGF